MKNRYLNINEAAKAVGVCVDTLRNYEKRGAISPARLPNGVRIFDAEDIAKARQIREQGRQQRRESK